MKDFYGETAKLISELTNFVNPIGRFYLKFQFIFRIIFCSVLLNDVIKTELVCDTVQIGCKDMCLNRFAPLTFKKLWELEMYFMQQV